MPPKNQASPFEIITPAKSKKAGGKGITVAILIVIFLILSVVAGVLLVRQRQQIQEKAAQKYCPAAEACPYLQQPSLLRDCHPGDSDGTPSEYLCDQKGRIETCGAANTQYCCPASGASWTTNLTACKTPSPSPTPTNSPTPTASAGATATPTGTPIAGECNSTCTSNSECASGYTCSAGSCRNPLCTSATNCLCTTATETPTVAPLTLATETPVPIPVTGVDWPTAAGIGIGAAAIILSILLAL